MVIVFSDYVDHEVPKSVLSTTGRLETISHGTINAPTFVLLMKHVMQRKPITLAPSELVHFYYLHSQNSGNER